MQEPYTKEVEGTEVVGIMFVPSDAQFLEFQDPDSHDEFCQLRDPRSGETKNYTSRLELMMADAMGCIRASIPVEQWMEFREMYVEADEHDFEEWEEQWQKMMEEDPRY